MFLVSKEKYGTLSIHPSVKMLPFTHLLLKIYNNQRPQNFFWDKLSTPWLDFLSSSSHWKKSNKNTQVIFQSDKSNPSKLMIKINSADI